MVVCWWRPCGQENLTIRSKEKHGSLCRVRGTLGMALARRRIWFILLWRTRLHHKQVEPAGVLMTCVTLLACRYLEFWTHLFRTCMFALHKASTNVQNGTAGGCTWLRRSMLAYVTHSLSGFPQISDRPNLHSERISRDWLSSLRLNWKFGDPGH